MSANPSLNGFDLIAMDMATQMDQDRWQKFMESLSGVSKLDLRVPNAAHREYEKGARLLMARKFDQALDPLTKAISIYPKYVGAHSALGLVYLNLGRSPEAESQFSQSIALDGHLPYAYLNLSWAQISLKNFQQAQESLQKASNLAPLDLHLLTALTYAQLLNHDYAGVIGTADKVHNRRHGEAAVVHYFAAAAWQGQENLEQAQQELQTFLSEAPQSPFANDARQMIEQIKDGSNSAAPAKVEIAYVASPLDSTATTTGISARAQTVMNQFEQTRQLAEVESEPESAGDSCAPSIAPVTLSANKPGIGEARPHRDSAYFLHSTVNEVAVFFTVTDHGKSVTDLAEREVEIQDAGKAPEKMLGFRNESELPLRLGLVIDTSNSIVQEFQFEQKAGATFVEHSLTGKNDSAFVVGFANQVLLVQDLTNDDTKIAAGIGQLAPAGGTALWDAVKFACDKLGSLSEDRPVAKMLVVITDGEDNSSSATLKEAIESAERHEVAIYVVSTQKLAGVSALGATAEIADRAMKLLAARSGGALFLPDSLGNLDHRLADLQQVIRSRYLISYKPSHFMEDGSYRPISVTAQKSGRKLRVYVRHGYYARHPSQPHNNEP